MLAGIQWFLYRRSVHSRSGGLTWRESTGRYLIAQATGRSAGLRAESLRESLPQPFVLGQRLCPLGRRGRTAASGPQCASS